MGLFQAVVLLILLEFVVSFNVIGKGYNLLLGNPDGVNPLSGGLDPGVIDRQIIEKSHLKQQQESVSHYCQEVTGVEWYYGERAYQNKLFKSVRVSGDGNYKIQTKAFLSSSQLHYLRDNVFSDFIVVQETQKICSYETLRQPLFNQYSGEYSSVSDEFAAAVCSLSPTYVNDEYKDFLEKWGTHVVIAVELGTKEITRNQISDIALYRYVQDQVPEAIFVTDTKDKHTIDFRMFKSHPAHRNTIGALLSHFTVGTKEHLRPISMNLISIDMMLQKKFWQRINKYIMQSLCSEATTFDDILKKKSNIVEALQNYAKNIHQPKESEVTVPINWPQGTYGIPKMTPQKYGGSKCPLGVMWDTISIQWCTESKRNDWSQSGHFAGSKSTNSIYLETCVKRDSGGYREVLPWSKGNYCIIKYQGCPHGFLAGYIQWQYPSSINSYASCTARQSYEPDGDANLKERKLYFCCRNDGDSATPIALPRQIPFYLIRNKDSKECQHVDGMLANEEYITWDNANATDPKISFFGGGHPLVNVTYGSDITMHFCFYHAN